MSREVHHVALPTGVELAFWRTGPADGDPLLLLHGWPETKRIYERVLDPLAAAGFDVVVPDLRGFGDSGFAPDGQYDIAVHARDVRALMTALGHETFALCAGDLGGPIAIDLGLRFAGSVSRQVLFNCPLPPIDGMPPLPGRTRAAADYFRAQGKDADAVADALRTPEERVAYVRQFYGSRFWASPGTFAFADAQWHAEPFATHERLRASFVNYEHATGTRRWTEKPRFFERVEVETVVLHGPDDHVVPPDFPERAELAFAHLVGPYVVPRCGHFLPWERPEVLVRTVRAFLRA